MIFYIYIYIYIIYVKYVQIHTLYKYTGFRGVHGSPKRLAHIGVDRLCHAACLDTLGPLHITRKGQLLRAAATARLYLYMPHSCHNSDSEFPTAIGECRFKRYSIIFHLPLKKKQLRNVKMKMKWGLWRMPLCLAEALQLSPPTFAPPAPLFPAPVFGAGRVLGAAWKLQWAVVIHSIGGFEYMDMCMYIYMYIIL